MGKTSLLREVQRRAEARRAPTTWVTAGDDGGLLPALAAELNRKTADWASTARSKLGGLLDALTLTVGVPGVAQIEANWTRRSEPAGSSPPAARELEAVVRGIVSLAADQHPGGLVLFVDEIQSADPAGLRALATAWQHLQAEGADVPAALFAAGLPNSPEAIGAVVTFSERFAYRPSGPLADDAARIALARPVEQIGVHWDTDAIEEAVSTAQGFPYTLQLFGDATWAAAGRPDPGARLTAAHVHTASAAVAADLAALFRARWEKASTAEQTFMAAMARLGDGPVARAASPPNSACPPPT